jgi:hypothetical protein
MKDLNTINEALENLGLETELQEGNIALTVNGYQSVLTIDDDNLVVVCELATLDQIKEGQEAGFMAAALEANRSIIPFAIATASGDDEVADVAVLIDSVPLGDFSESELESLVESLRSALLESAGVLKIGLE